MSYRISLDPAELDIDLIHAFLSGAYWAIGIPRHIVERAVANSICVAAFAKDEKGADEQIGFARVVSDRATFAYLDDVFVLPAHRGKGVAKAMVEALRGVPDLQNLKIWLLLTRDMQPLYAGLGFKPFPHPENVMTRIDPEAWTQ